MTTTPGDQAVTDLLRAATERTVLSERGEVTQEATEPDPAAGLEERIWNRVRQVLNRHGEQDR